MNYDTDESLNLLLSLLLDYLNLNFQQDESDLYWGIKLSLGASLCSHSADDWGYEESCWVDMAQSFGFVFIICVGCVQISSYWIVICNYEYFVQFIRATSSLQRKYHWDNKEMGVLAARILLRLLSVFEAKLYLQSCWSVGKHTVFRSVEYLSLTLNHSPFLEQPLSE